MTRIWHVYNKQGNRIGLYTKARQNGKTLLVNYGEKVKAERRGKYTSAEVNKYSKRHNTFARKYRFI